MVAFASIQIQRGMTAHRIQFDQVQLSRPAEGAARLHFTLEPGAAVVVVGRNGAGKSTMLHTLAGLLAPQSGRVLLGDANIHSMPPSRRAQRISLVTSTPPKPAGLTVADVMALGRRAGDGSGQLAELDADLSAAGIAEWRKLPMDSLSDGMAQRVMVARAGVQSRSVMLLDEPTAFLDLVGREEVLQQMAHWKGDNRTLIVATHDLEAAAAAGWFTHWLHLHPGRDHGATLHHAPLDVDAAKAALRAD